MRLLAALLLFPVMLFAATESVSIDTKTKKVQNPIVNFGAGNTLNGTGATIIGFPGSSYTFIDSLTQSAGNVSLVNDSASPGNSKYYGTNSSGTLGYFTLTAAGGSFLSANTARVDPSGNDSTGTIGDLTKPFLTVQAAIDAFEASPPTGPYALIDIGNNAFSEDVTTSLPEIWFYGLVGQAATQAFGSLTTTHDSANVGIVGCGAGTIISAGNGIIVYPMAGGFLYQGVTSTTGDITILSQDGAGVLEGTISAPGFIITLYNFNNDNVDNITIDSANSTLVAYRTRIKSIINADVNTDLIDSRVTDTNNSAAVTSQHDIMLDPKTMNFATLPTSIPAISGRAWNFNGLIVDGAHPTTLSGYGITDSPVGANPTASVGSTVVNGSASTFMRSDAAPPLASNLRVGGFTAHFSRGGAAIQANDVLVTPWTCPYSGTITGYSISADTGTCTLKTWKKANGTAIPTIADVISTSGVALSTGTHIRSSTVSDFTTTTVTAGDMFMAQVTATSGPTDITFQVEITR